MTSKILAIVPAYNEEENIVSTIEDLKSSAPGVDCVVIDDGSRDRTAAICRERGYRCISLPVNLGLAGGFQTGMKYALRHGYDYAIQFDADGQHSAAYIEPMVEFARASNANIVIGSRFCSQKRPLSPRMAGSVLISAMIRLTTGARIKDPTSGMRLFDKSMIPLFANELDYSPEPDTIVDWLHFMGHFHEGLRYTRKEVPGWRIRGALGSSARSSSGRSCSSTTTASPSARLGRSTI